MARADVVFTGGQDDVRGGSTGAMPTCIASHPVSIRRPFRPGPRRWRARPIPCRPGRRSPHPRIGFFGVIDERFDVALLRDVAAANGPPGSSCCSARPPRSTRPISRAPRTSIGWAARPIPIFPAYLAHWEAGWMPFARNEATRFISPTKTPEFLAAGLPVVSTPITDVVRPLRRGRRWSRSPADAPATRSPRSNARSNRFGSGMARQGRSIVWRAVRGAEHVHRNEQDRRASVAQQTCKGAWLGVRLVDRRRGVRRIHAGRTDRPGTWRTRAGRRSP